MKEEEKKVIEEISDAEIAKLFANVIPNNNTVLLSTPLINEYYDNGHGNIIKKAPSVIEQEKEEVISKKPMTVLAIGRGVEEHYPTITIGSKVVLSEQANRIGMIMREGHQAVLVNPHVIAFTIKQ